MSNLLRIYRSGLVFPLLNFTVKNTELSPIPWAKVVVTSASLHFPLEIKLDVSSHGMLENLPTPAYYPLPPTIHFSDWDANPGYIRGTITWNQDNDESHITGYDIYFTGYNVSRVKIGHVAKGEPRRFTISTSTMIPQGTYNISIVAMDDKNHETLYGLPIYIQDSYSDYQVKAAIRHEYFNGVTEIDIGHILSTLNNPLNPFSEISKEDTQVLLSLIKPLIQ